MVYMLTIPTTFFFPFVKMISNHRSIFHASHQITHKHSHEHSPFFGGHKSKL